MNVYAHTDVGMRRAQNEDVYAVCPLADAESVLAVLCDGMGGEQGGRRAAELCASHIHKFFLGQKTPSKRALRAALFEANRAVFRAKSDGDGECARMGTTVVTALAEPERLTVFWVGDSRAYLDHGGTLSRLTRDHSFVEEEIAAGRLSPDAARLHPMRNMITRAVGAAPTVKCDCISLPWAEGDRLLLCSDGLHGELSDTEIGEILCEDEPIGLVAHGLVHAANNHGGDDNVTVLLIENTKEKTSHA